MSDVGTTTTSKPVHAHNTEEGDAESQIARLREDLSKLTSAVADFGTSQAEKTGHDLAETSKETIEAVRAEVSTIETEVKSSIRENPLQAVGIAAGIGFVAALLTRH